MNTQGSREHDEAKRSGADCRGRTVIVTGAAGAIGSALVRRLYGARANVVMIDRNGAALDRLYDDMVAGNPDQNASAPALVELDITTADSNTYEELVHETLATFGRLTNLVHCAGTLRPLSPVEHIDPEDLDTSLAVWVQAAFRLTKACISPLRDASANGIHASIVFTTANADAINTAYWSAYAVSLGAINALAKVLTDELDQPPEVSVHTVDPGDVRSPFQSTAFPGRSQRYAIEPSECVEQYMRLMMA